MDDAGFGPVDLPYGWRDFDQRVVRAVARDDAEFIAKRAEGGMRCPLIGHSEWLRWLDSSHKKGTVPHGSPEVAFRVKPTYILSDPLDNFIVGRDLISAAIRGEWDKAETHRLGHEDSEDALTFNVFRSLQEAGELERVARLVTGVPVPEPDLFLWGRHVERDGSSATWEALEAARQQVEPHHRQQTEPDACLHVRGWGWIFIEAKFDFGIKKPKDAAKLASWLELYPRHAPELFDLEHLFAVSHREMPEQLLRNMVFAQLIRATGERAHVVSLGRRLDRTPTARWLSACLAPDSPVTASCMSWEQIYDALPRSARLARLRIYLESKSFALRRAFSLRGQPSRPRTSPVPGVV